MKSRLCLNHEQKQKLEEQIYKDLYPKVKERVRKDVAQDVIKDLGNHMDATFLYAVNQILGVKKPTLKKIYFGYLEERRKLIQHYDIEEEYTETAAMNELHKLGINLDEWTKEYYG